MRILNLAVLFFLTIFITNCTQHYRANVLELGLGFSAQAMCSCLWVSQNDEDFCREYIALKQVQPKIKVDHQKKSVQANAFLIFSRSSIFKSNEKGCELQ